MEELLLETKSPQVPQEAENAAAYHEMEVIAPKVELFVQAAKKRQFSYLAARVFLSPEIPMALLFFASGLFMPAQQYFIYNRICLYNIDSNSSPSICEEIDTLPELKDQESLVQLDYSRFSSIMQFASYGPVIFVALIFGTWCDRFTHRIPMALPQFGCIAVTLIYMFVSFLPNEAINPVYLGWVSFFIGITGSTSCAAMGAFSYTARASTRQTRTLRLAIMEACPVLGENLGFVVSAFLFNGGHDFNRAFLVQIALHLYSIFYIFVLVPELHCFSDVKAKVKEEANGSWAKYLLSPKENLTSAFKIIFGKHPHRTPNQRRWLIFMLLTYTFSVVTVGSKVLQQVVYAFVTLQPISLSAFQYAIFQAIWLSGLGFALFVFVPFLRSHLIPHLLPFSDAALGITGFLGRMCGLFALGLGGLYPTIAPWVYCVLCMPSIFAFVSVRSGMSKITKEFEHGRIFAVNSLFESFANVFVGIGFNALYGVTVSYVPERETIPEAVIHGYPILFNATLCLVPLIVMIRLGMQPIRNWSFHRSSQEANIEPIAA